MNLYSLETNFRIGTKLGASSLRDIMRGKVGDVQESVENSSEFVSSYLDEGIIALFDDELARRYQPIIYDKKGFGSQPFPVGIYYRILKEEREYAIQFYFYWEEQDCTAAYPLIGGLFSHEFDYEPIIVFIGDERVLRVALAGAGGLRKGGHQTEIYEDLGSTSWGRVRYETQASPRYPFGVHSEEDSFKSDSITRVRFKGTRPEIGIATCYHVFTPLENYLSGEILDIPLKRLTDEVLEQWYNEEHFGHDVSNPWSHPYIKFHPPPKIEEEIDERGNL
jgi:hypothetical protein